MGLYILPVLFLYFFIFFKLFVTIDFLDPESQNLMD